MVLQLHEIPSDIFEDELRQFSLDFFIPLARHPEVPDENACIADFPDGKIGVYTRFFEFANQRVPLSLFYAMYLIFIASISLKFTLLALPNLIILRLVVA